VQIHTIFKAKIKPQVAESKQEVMNLTKAIKKKLSKDLWAMPI
jgi:hypothetical protein